VPHCSPPSQPTGPGRQVDRAVALNGLALPRSSLLALAVARAADVGARILPGGSQKWAVRHIRRSCDLSRLTNSAAHWRASGIFPASLKARAFAKAWLSADRSAAASLPGRPLGEGPVGTGPRIRGSDDGRNVFPTALLQPGQESLRRRRNGSATGSGDRERRR
jgi:hypothetical protein